MRVLLRSAAQWRRAGRSTTPLLLACWLAGQCKRLQLGSASVLELGCGVGAVGLYAAALGASAVLTDADDACLALARENANRNSELLRGAVDVQPYRWGVAPPDGGPFSLILGADITYEARSHRALTKTLHTLVSAEAPPRVLQHSLSRLAAATKVTQHGVHGTRRARQLLGSPVRARARIISTAFPRAYTVGVAIRVTGITATT